MVIQHRDSGFGGLGTSNHSVGTVRWVMEGFRISTIGKIHIGSQHGLTPCPIVSLVGLACVMAILR